MHDAPTATKKQQAAKTRGWQQAGKVNTDLSILSFRFQLLHRDPLTLPSQMRGITSPVDLGYSLWSPSCGTCWNTALAVNQGHPCNVPKPP